MLGNDVACPPGGNSTGVAGVSGFMADFAEYLPFDSTLFSGVPLEAHNMYPVIWSQVVTDAVRSAASTDTNGKSEHDVVPFCRSGGLKSAGSVTGLFWAGDQLVSWDGYDGMATVMRAHMSLGMSGISMSHSDIGGYTMLNSTISGVNFKYLRSKELLQRWMEMSAFTDTIYRTHPGNLPASSAQWNSDNDTLSHFGSFSRVHAFLGDYRKELMKEALDTGAPLVRHTFLHYPDDANVRSLLDQFLLGSELLVAPVVSRGAQTVKVYLPVESGGWVHAWSGDGYPGGGNYVVNATMGEPGLFYKRSSVKGKEIALGVVKVARTQCYHQEDPDIHKCFEACAEAQFVVKGIEKHGSCSAIYDTIDKQTVIVQCPDGITNVRYCDTTKINVTVTRRGEKSFRG